MRENLQQISVKIDPKTLAAIDSFSKNTIYWKRNAIINGVLTKVFEKCSEQDIYNLLTVNYNYRKKIRINVDIVDKEEK